MKKIYAILFSIILSLSLYSQEDGNLGLMLGTTSYFGEFNQYVPFINPYFMGGLVYKQTFKYRFGLRININFVALKGNSQQSMDLYERSLNQSFTNMFGEVHLGGEYNFMRFDMNKPKDYFLSPYILAGVSFLNVPDPYNAFDFAFPIGFGVKYALSKKIMMGIELSYYWTYTDYLDKLPVDNYSTIQRSYNTNPDSYMILGLYITYQVFKNKPPCPVYTYF